MAASHGNAYDSDKEVYEPLNTLQMRVNNKNGVLATVPALHIGFMETKSYIQFMSPPLMVEDTGQNTLTAEEQEWLESIYFLEEDLRWLLKLPHHRFLSQVLYDENLHRCLESYLSQAPRDYDLVNLKMKDEVLDMLKLIHKLVFLVYLRMSTYKESKKHHISPDVFGSYIYENFLFDIPKLMDLCALYGFQNQPIIQKMILNIFSTQPKYTEDLHEISSVILEVFNTIEEKLSKHSSERESFSKDAVNQLSVREQISVLPFHDVVNYVTDVSATLHAFLEIYPEGCQAFYQNDAPVRIATFYEQAFTMIEKEISVRRRNKESESILEEIKRKTTLSKTLLIKIYRNILNYCCIQLILDYGVDKGSENPYAEHFLEIFTMLAAEKNFLRDYNNLFPFDSDFELFQQLGLKLDSERLSYIFSSIHETGDIVPEPFISSVSNGARPKTKRHVDSIPTLQNAAALLKEPPVQQTRSSNYNGDYSDNHSLNDLELNSLIQSVLDVFPELGDGFIEKCLHHFNLDAERVIDAILNNDSLPGHLNELDRNMKRSSVSSEYSVLSERKNVFDNDQFDLFNRDDIDMSNIHMGKKNKTPSTYETLKNDEETEFLKQLTLKYGYEEESDHELNLYEDEYDDTYDSAMVGLKEPAGEVDAPVRADNDEEEPETSEPSRDTSKDFCVNPEIVREKAEQRYQARRAAKRGGRREGPPPSDTAQSRQKKDQQKSRIGNHNRRSQADFKRSKGMGPLS